MEEELELEGGDEAAAAGEVAPKRPVYVSEEEEDEDEVEEAMEDDAE